MIFSCAVSFESKKKKIPDLSLPPCIPTLVRPWIIRTTVNLEYAFKKYGPLVTVPKSKMNEDLDLY